MRKQIISILLLGLICGASKTYSEYWSEFKLKKTIKESAYLEVNSQCRFKSGVGRIYYFRTEIGPILKLGKFMEVGIYYTDKEIKEKKEWHTTSILSLYETFSAKLSDIHFNDRNRFDYEDFEFFRYRNLLEIKRPYTIYEASSYYGDYPTIWRIIPCIEEEIFYNFKENQIDESRFLLGVSIELYRLLDIRIAGLLHSQREEKWTHKGAFVTTVQLIFLEEE